MAITPWQFLVFGAALGLRLYGGDIALAGYGLLALYALSGYRQVIQALAVSCLLSQINPGLLVDPAPVSALGSVAVVLASGLSVGLRKLRARRTVLPAATAATILLTLFMVVNGIFVSYQTDVSLFKAIYFSLIFLSLLGAWNGLLPEKHRQLVNWIYVFLLAIVVASLPLAVTAVGFLRNGSGFQGVLSHPQVFGSLAGVLAAWTTARLLASRVPSLPNLGLMAVLALAVVASEARTGGLALIAALAGALLAFSLGTRKSFLSYAPGLASGRFWAAALVGLLLLIAAWTVVAGAMTDYLFKRSNVESLEEAMDMSRGRLVREMWANIEETPFTGIGFGVASNPSELIVKRDPVFDLPISASIEKGVLPLAVLEELGLFGALLVAWWLLTLLGKPYRAGLTPLAVSFAILATNLGEYTLFAPNGNGLILLVVLTAMATITPATMPAS